MTDDDRQLKNMSAALMYHDVVRAGSEDVSGFPGRDAARYKVTPEAFDTHLQAIARAVRAGATPTMTFDDGGVSALYAADALEQYGLRGYFFVTVDYIGTSGFLDEVGIRELHARGHVIGSHSCSHPLRMSHCSPLQVSREWTTSRARLSDIVGHDVRVASVPGGDYVSFIAEAAADVGFVRLFTSEPTVETRQVDELTVNGRFTIQRWTTAKTAAGLATGEWLPHARQAVMWNIKKLPKRIGGDGYLRLRKLILRHGDEVQWGDQST